MFRRPKDYLFILIISIVFFLFSFVFNGFLSYTMPRHQAIQLPIMFGIGIAIALYFKTIKIKKPSWAYSALIFIFFSLIFWMLPLSIDNAVIYPIFNRIMHVHIMICGILLVASFRFISFEIRTFFLGMLAAKLATIGIVMRVFNILLCGSFTIRQQQETGTYFIIIGTVLFIYTFIRFFNPALYRQNQE